ncbi:hypothetical protein PR048_023479 [Dryococelus australis]|uniref:Uncharacterized protein n=1 Tax=Dryococelus australis TaxID=614101 RepID=A0ABQ9GUA7_9NEOP|nr:hypothetical protein PR048_023479 [Dryococelus australis]
MPSSGVIIVRPSTGFEEETTSLRGHISNYMSSTSYKASYPGLLQLDSIHSDIYALSNCEASVVGSPQLIRHYHSSANAGFLARLSMRHRAVKVGRPAWEGIFHQSTRREVLPRSWELTLWRPSNSQHPPQHILKFGYPASANSQSQHSSQGERETSHPVTAHIRGRWSVEGAEGHPSDNTHMCIKVEREVEGAYLSRCCTLVAVLSCRRGIRKTMRGPKKADRALPPPWLGSRRQERVRNGPSIMKARGMGSVSSSPAVGNELEPI